MDVSSFPQCLPEEAVVQTIQLLVNLRFHDAHMTSP